MKQLIFVVDENKSYIQSLGWPSVKAKQNLPLTVPLSPGGTINLSIDEKKYVAKGNGSDLKFFTDQFEKSSTYNITGKPQTLSVKLSDLDLSFDPKNGDILSGGGYTFVQGEPSFGYGGSLALGYLGPSSLHDGNSIVFDISNGLGCGGSLILEMGCGNPTNFIIHIEATVGKEDADGDGKYELTCPSGIWKEFKLEYDPPKIRIIIPERGPAGRWHSGMTNVVHAIRFPEFLELVRDQRHAREELPKPEFIEFVGAPDSWLVLFDSSGRVYGGSLSDELSKLVHIPLDDVENILIGIVPNLGVAVNHPLEMPDPDRRR
jgi:hypothetical protein